MPTLTLIIGNKNYSSWSLRPWLLAHHLGHKFTELLIPLDRPDSSERIHAVNPAGRVPALRHADQLVWESIAMCEYLCELAGRGLPIDARWRAMARSVSAEMHSGFQALRQQWPMNARATDRHTPMNAPLQADLMRIESIWTDCRALSKSIGPWLFGDYSMADAMYAPVVLRLNTYGSRVTLTPVVREYMATTLADPLLQEWLEAAASEPWTLHYDGVGL